MHVNPLAIASPLLAGLASSGLTAGPARGQPSAPRAGFAAALHIALAATAGRRSGHHEGSPELDPAVRQAAQLAPPILSLEVSVQPRTPTSPAQCPAPAQQPQSLEEILPALVRRIAWSGDGRRGAVRIELGAGDLEGATLLVAADAGRVRVTLSGVGLELESWRERIANRLQGKGLDIEVT